MANHPDKSRLQSSGGNHMPLVMMVCTGLGGISRGFETYMHQLATSFSLLNTLSFHFLTLSAYRNDDVTYRHQRLPAISRNNKLLDKFFKDLHTQFHFEQMTLLPSFLIYIIIKKPKLIYLGEYQLYCYLYKIREIFKLTFSLCLHTGGQAMPGLFDKNRDWVHHITNRFWLDCITAGIPVKRMFLLPHPVGLRQAEHVEKPVLLLKANGKKVVLCVGSIDEKIKGVLTLAKALANYPEIIFPVFLGEPTADTSELIEYLEQYFGQNYIVTKVNHTELPDWYAYADLLVSASKAESFGLVMLESLMQGTPIICFRWAAAEWVFKEHGNYFISTNPKEMGSQIMELINRQDSKEQRICRKQFVEDTYGWETLLHQYERMFTTMLTTL
jgi:glycosyltransferase involved in cell wall biosynthesis